jgi:hypothetical protein
MMKIVCYALKILIKIRNHHNRNNWALYCIMVHNQEKLPARRLVALLESCSYCPALFSRPKEMNVFEIHLTLMNVVRLVIYGIINNFISVNRCRRRIVIGCFLAV